jgi:uncharacterized membrane protein YdjX (TVP38/TMEM64 family)
MQQIFAFVEFYVSPLLFAIGFIFLFNGIINYYVIGPNFEEERREKGRQCLLWATFLFVLGLLVFSIAHWLLSLSTQIQDRPDIDVDVGSQFDTLKVPNVPGLPGE